MSMRWLMRDMLILKYINLAQSLSPIETETCGSSIFFNISPLVTRIMEVPHDSVKTHCGSLGCTIGEAYQRPVQD